MLKKLLEAEPPPSPRQLATAQLARSLLIARVSLAMDTLKPDEQQKLSEATGVPADKATGAQDDASKAEEDGLRARQARTRSCSSSRAAGCCSRARRTQAVAEIRKAIKMDRTRAQFYVELAKALMAKPGGEKEAAEALATALKTMGDSPKLVVDARATPTARRTSWTTRSPQYQRAVKDPKAKNPEARLAMGTIYRERSDWDKAQEQLEKAATEFIGQPDRAALALAELGRVYEGKGDTAKADETFQKALKADERLRAGLLLLRHHAQQGPQAGRQGQDAGAGVPEARAQGRARSPAAAAPGFGQGQARPLSSKSAG